MQHALVPAHLQIWETPNCHKLCAIASAWRLKILLWYRSNVHLIEVRGCPAEATEGNGAGRRRQHDGSAVPRAACACGLLMWGPQHVGHRQAARRYLGFWRQCCALGNFLSQRLSRCGRGVRKTGSRPGTFCHRNTSFS